MASSVKKSKRQAISNKVRSEPSGKAKLKAEQNRGASSGGGVDKNARVSPYLKETAVDGLNITSESSGRSPLCIENEPPGATLITPQTVATKPHPERKAACTFVDSVISFCTRPLASCDLICAPVPHAQLFFLLFPLFCL